MRRDFKTKYDVVNEIKKTMLYIIIINHMHISNNSKATASESQDIIKLVSQMLHIYPNCTSSSL